MVSSTLRLYRYGNIVYAAFMGYVVSAGGASTIPSGYRPALNHTFQALSFNGGGVNNAMASVIISPNGYLQGKNLSNSNAAVTVWCSTIWITAD